MFKNFFKKYWVYFFVLVYIIFPIDLVPDEIPLIGNVDDTLLLFAGILKQYIQYRREESNGV